MTVVIFHYWRRCWLLGTSPLFRGVSYSSDGSLAIVLDIVLSHIDCFHENSNIHPPRQPIDDNKKELTLIPAQREPGWNVEWNMLTRLQSDFFCSKQTIVGKIQIRL